MSEDENSYYEIAQDRGYGKSHAGSGGSNVGTSKPYFVKAANRADIASTLQTNPDWTVSPGEFATVTVSINYETNTISWEWTSKGQTWTGSFTDADLPNMLANAKYPVAALGVGDGYARYNNITINYEATPSGYNYETDFDDVVLTDSDFHGSVIEKGTVVLDKGTTDTTSRLTGETVSTTNAAQKLFSVNGGDWILSKVHVGRYVNDYPGGGGYYENGMLYVRDRHAWKTTANLDLGEKKYLEISKIKTTAKSASSTDIAHGIRFMVNSNENSYYEIGVSRNANNPHSGLGVSQQPYFAKIKNGSLVDINTDATYKALVNTSATMSGTQYKGMQNYEIEVTGNTITFSLTAGDYSWTGTVTDPELTSYVAATRYPIAAYVSGDGYALYD